MSLGGQILRRHFWHSYLATLTLWTLLIDAVTVTIGWVCYKIWESTRPSCINTTRKGNEKAYARAIRAVVNDLNGIHQVTAKQALYTKTVTKKYFKICLNGKTLCQQNRKTGDIKFYNNDLSIEAAARLAIKTLAEGITLKCTNKNTKFFIKLLKLGIDPNRVIGTNGKVYASLRSIHKLPKRYRDEVSELLARHAKQKKKVPQATAIKPLRVVPPSSDAAVHSRTYSDSAISSYSPMCSSSFFGSPTNTGKSATIPRENEEDSRIIPALAGS